MDAASFAEEFFELLSRDGWRPSLVRSPDDFLELYAGCCQLSRAWLNEEFRVMPPLDLRRGWDLRNQKLFWGLLGFIRCGKVKFLWWAPPCDSFFSLSRGSKLRSLERAWGYRLLDESTLLGNLHAAQCLLLSSVPPPTLLRANSPPLAS